MKERLSEKQIEKLWSFFDQNCPWDSQHSFLTLWPVSLRKMGLDFGVSKNVIARQYKDYVRLHAIQSAQDNADMISVTKWRQELMKAASIPCQRYYADGRPTIEKELCHQIQDFLIEGKLYSYQDIREILTAFTGIVRTSQGGAATNIRFEFDPRSIRQRLLKESGISGLAPNLTRVIHSSDFDILFEKKAINSDGDREAFPVSIWILPRIQLVSLRFEDEKVQFVGEIMKIEDRLKLIASKDNAKQYNAIVLNEKGDRSAYLILRDAKGAYMVLKK
jgi:hypothetical protein